MKREKSAGAVIFRREGSRIYYLLLHYESGHWDFPKGHIEEGESDREAVVREIKEETGIKDIRFIEGFKEKISYFFRHGPKYKKKKNSLVHKEVLFYLAETKQKEVKISFEHIGFEWLAAKEALERATFENAKEILEKAIKRIETDN